MTPSAAQIDGNHLKVIVGYKEDTETLTSLFLQEL
jgi:hypothetical protein